MRESLIIYQGITRRAAGRFDSSSAPNKPGRSELRKMVSGPHCVSTARSRARRTSSLQSKDPPYPTPAFHHLEWDFRTSSHQHTQDPHSANFTIRASSSRTGSGTAAALTAGEPGTVRSDAKSYTPIPELRRLARRPAAQLPYLWVQCCSAAGAICSMGRRRCGTSKVVALRVSAVMQDSKSPAWLLGGKVTGPLAFSHQSLGVFSSATEKNP